MPLTYVLTTRKRPDDVLRSLQDTLPNMELEDTRILVCIDDDDPETVDVLDHYRNDERVILSVKPREDSVGEKCDRALTEAPADLYLVGHDCVPILTPGWDRIVSEAGKIFPDGIGCVYTPMANAAFPAFQAPTAGLVEKIGYIYSHRYPFWFRDHELDDICRMIGRYAFVNVKLEIAERRPGITIRLRELEFWTLFFDLETLYRRGIARDIIDSPDFDAPEWQKRMLRTWYPAIEARSLNINWGVRENAASIEADRGDPGEPDPGYQRLRYLAGERLKLLSENMMQMAA